jgi:RNA polymerase sigma-70 factor (ECF subfamily)
VAAAIESLPHRQRVALTLFEYEGLSYEQVAAVLDVSTDSVRSLLLRARATLRGKLAGLV